MLFINQYYEPRYEVSSTEFVEDCVNVYLYDNDYPDDSDLMLIFDNSFRDIVDEFVWMFNNPCRDRNIISFDEDLEIVDEYYVGDIGIDKYLIGISAKDTKIIYRFINHVNNPVKPSKNYLYYEHRKLVKQLEYMKKEILKKENELHEVEYFLYGLK